MYECMLTTTDNPYDPFEQFTLWLLFDNEHGYNSCGYLMRIAELTDDMSSKEANDEIDRAIDEILANDFLGIRKKAFRKIENT